MGKVIKVNLENENKEETNMDNNVNKNEPAVNNGTENKELAPAKKKGLLDYIWKDRGIVGKAGAVVGGAAVMVGIGIGIKLLVGALFGQEAADAIDPEAFAPTDE